MMSRPIARLLALCSLAVLSALALSPWYLRSDWTDERLYTLSTGTRHLIRDLNEPLVIKLYISRSLRDLPPVLQSHGRRIEELLQAYAREAKGRIQVEIIDPRPDSDDEVWAQKYGVRGLPSPHGDKAYLGAVLIAGDRELALPFLDPRKEDSLEFDISEAIVRLSRRQPPRLGIYASLPIGANGSHPTDAGGRLLDWLFLQRLKDFYEIAVYPIAPVQIPDEIQIFVLMHPKNVDEQLEAALDTFVRRGGRLLVILDSFSRFEVQSHLSPDAAPPRTVEPPSSSLPRLLKAWGLSFHDEAIVGDLSHASQVQLPDTQRVTHPLFLQLDADAMNRQHVITAGLRQMLWVEGGSFEIGQLAPGLNAEVLLSTSDQAGVYPNTVNSFADPQGIAARISSDHQRRPLALLLRGTFPAVFPASTPAAGVSQEPGLVLLIGDSDFLQDQYAIEKLQMGEQWVQKPANDNVAFLTNALGFLSGSEELLGLRASGRLRRPFLRLRELQQEALSRWQAQEMALTQKIERMGQSRAQLEASGAAGSSAELASLRQQELALRGERRELRRRLRENVEQLQHRLIALNLLLAPGLMSMAGWFVHRRRNR